MDPGEIEEQIRKQLRMNGLVNSELDVIRRLDREIERESDVIPVAMKDGYVQESRSSVADTERFAALGRFVSGRLKQAGREILSGEAGIRPYKQGNRTPCDYCPYHAVCGFDAKTAGFGFRRLRSLRAPGYLAGDREGRGRDRMQWTEKQQQVIDSRDRNLLVSAAAGKRQDRSAGGAHHPDDKPGRSAVRY